MRLLFLFISLINYHSPTINATFNQFSVKDATYFLIQIPIKDKRFFSDKKYIPHNLQLDSKLFSMITDHHPETFTGRWYNYKCKDENLYLHVIQNNFKLRWILTSESSSRYTEMFWAETDDLLALPVQWSSTKKKITPRIYMCINHRGVDALKRLVCDASLSTLMNCEYNKTIGRLTQEKDETAGEQNNLIEKLDECQVKLDRAAYDKTQLTFQLLSVKNENERYRQLLNASYKTTPNTSSNNTSSSSLINAKIDHDSNHGTLKMMWISCGLSVLFGSCLTCLLFVIYHRCNRKKNQMAILKPMKYNIHGIQSVLNKKQTRKSKSSLNQVKNQNSAVSSNDLNPKEKCFKELMQNSVAIQNAVLDDIVDDMETAGKVEVDEDDIILEGNEFTICDSYTP